MEVNINWEKNFFVYSLTTKSFFENQDESYQINEALNNLKRTTWKINHKSGAEEGDYLFIKLGKDKRTNRELKNVEKLKRAIYGIAKIEKITDENVSFVVINNFYDNPIEDEAILNLNSMKGQGRGLFKFHDIEIFKPIYIEYAFRKWIIPKVDISTVSMYILSLKYKVPQHLQSISEGKYDNLFKCSDIEYLKKLYKRLKKHGDLHVFNIETNSRTPSAAISKYINFLVEYQLYGTDSFKEIDKTKKVKEINALKETEQYTNESLGNLNFSHKNLLLKGVPGTGKSHTLETIIENDLNLKNKPKNICHINIHSASSNADLMQGIGINSNGGQIEYKEKQGLIYNHIKKALFTPNQPFVLILEEIQENSLNELIGDLIYLIEEKKRVTVDSTKFEDGEEYEYQEFIEKVLEDENNKHSIQIPYLVDTSTDYRKMVLPSNLYIFCTSNYRDDKKVIEDNLLRRFDVVEVYPKYEGIFESTDIPQFLKILNQEFLKQFDQEMHPDRYLVGHANWLYITNEDSEKNKKRFYTALLKVIIELKEIREIDFKNYTKKILEKVLQDTNLSYRIKEYIEACNFEYKSYKEMVEKLQSKIYPFL